VKNYEPVMTFDEEMADIYDDTPVHAGNDPGAPAIGDTDATVTFLERLAHGGPALELAIGTGRIALPLSARGIIVDGIDFSEAMVRKLRTKPGGIGCPSPWGTTLTSTLPVRTGWCTSSRIRSRTC
jgi:hypothetical protein